MTGGLDHSLSAHPLPRGKSGGGRSSSLVPAAPSAQPGVFPVDPAQLPSASVEGPFHPRQTRAIRGGGPASPMRPNGGCLNREPNGAAASNTERLPFVSDCLSQPRRGIVPVAGAAGGGRAMIKSPYVRDITGHRNGRLIAIKCVGLDKDQRALWLCRCDCGTEKVVQSNNLVRPTGTKSCGCLRREANASNPQPGDPCHTLAKGAHAPAVAFQDRTRGDDGRGYDRPPPISEEVTGTLETVKQWNVATPWAVRRLTPVECERLMDFPDGFTAIPWRKKPASACPDGPRYKALGNSWAVNVAEWVGERIAIVDAWPENETRAARPANGDRHAEAE